MLNSLPPRGRGTAKRWKEPSWQIISPRKTHVPLSPSPDSVGSSLPEGASITNLSTRKNVEMLNFIANGRIISSPTGENSKSLVGEAICLPQKRTICLHEKMRNSLPLEGKVGDVVARMRCNNEISMQHLTTAFGGAYPQGEAYREEEKFREGTNYIFPPRKDAVFPLYKVFWATFFQKSREKKKKE